MLFSNPLMLLMKKPKKAEVVVEEVKTPAGVK